MIPDAVLDQIRARVALSEVIGGAVKLVRTGRREFKGLCPFHAEKTPSFTVSDEKGFYHCFGCGAHGDGLDWLQRRDGLTFREAVEALAGRAGVDLPRAAPTDPARVKRVADLREALRIAHDWFKARLVDAIGAEARALLTARGVTGASVERFGLGYAPATGLEAALGAAGVPPALAEAAGLTRMREGQRRLVFRDRLMIPIHDERGQLVGFGGRAVGDTRGPKYLNTPETEVFHKGRVLFNAHRAREAAFARCRLVVVEGYLDVIALDQAGVAEVVAPLGTAVTEDQVRLMWRLAPEPVVCLDGDAAGTRAAARLVEAALPVMASGFDLRVARLPGAQDPDDLCRTGAPMDLEAVLALAAPSESILFEAVREGRRLDSAARWRALAEALDALAAEVRDPQRREAVRRALRDLLDQERTRARPPRARTAVVRHGLFAVLEHAIRRGLTPAGWERLHAAGVSEDAACRTGGIGALWVRETAPGVFEIADPTVQPDAFGAFVAPVLPHPLDWPACAWVLPDPTLALVDLVAWDIADPTRWLVARGGEPWMGRRAVEVAREALGTLRLHKTPLDWIVAGGIGAVWLPGRATAAGVDCLRAALDGVGRVVCSDPGHADAVNQALRLRPALPRAPALSFLLPDDRAA